MFFYNQSSKLHIRNDDLLGDFCDGSLYKNHSLFSSAADGDGTLYLQIVMYYDDIEVNNPLGSRRGKHKLGKHIHTTYIVTMIYLQY